uniref:Uncharacterized protein n=1 Tax=Branchiostoma floridae TaxID=7739 RepID=C3YBP4_BRAFL|eukprot:XP_002606391.1 hypothetical protein BRAFLDRAFT_67639 [Branchiostoma floridae]
MAASRCLGVQRDNKQLGKVAPLKLGVSQFAIATCGGNMYVFGGERRSTTTTTRRTGCVQRYNPAEDEWTFATPLPDKPWPGKAFTIKANVYLFGGEMDGILCYDPLTDCYEKVHETDSWVLSGHDEFSSTVCGSEIYIVGGRRTKVYPGTKPKPTVRCCNVTSGIWLRLYTSRNFPKTTGMAETDKDPFARLLKYPFLEGAFYFGPLVPLWLSSPGCLASV